MSIPGLVCLLTLLVALERLGLWVGRASWLPWRRRETARLPMSAAAFDIFGAAFNDRRAEFEQRDVQLMIRPDEAQGAPPRTRVDLDSGRVWLFAPAHRPTTSRPTTGRASTDGPSTSRQPTSRPSTDDPPTNDDPNQPPD